MRSYGGTSFSKPEYALKRAEGVALAIASPQQHHRIASESAIVPVVSAG
jgi:hypothetical protein